MLTLILTCVAFFWSFHRTSHLVLVPEIFRYDVRDLAMTSPVLIQWIANRLWYYYFPLRFT